MLQRLLENGRGRVAWILLAFLITRLAVLALEAPEIRAGDAVQYIRVAASVMDHGLVGYLDPGYVVQKGSYYPWFEKNASLPDGEYNPIFWDPLYPLFLAGVYSVAGLSHGAVRLAQLLLSLLTLLLGMDAVRRMFPRDPRAPAVFGWLMVAYLPLAGFVTKLLAETLDAFLLTTCVWMLTRMPRSRPGAFFAFGALLGLYVSVKSYWLPLIPVILVLCGWLLARLNGEAVARPRLGACLALVLAGTVLVLTPTFVRNYRVSEGAVLISTKGSWNFWKDDNHLAIVNHAWREEGLNVHSWLREYYRLGAADRVPASLEGVYYDASETKVRPPCDTTLDLMVACERAGAIAFFLDDPLRFGVRALEKNANLWSPNNYVFSRAPPGNFAWHQNQRIELPIALRYLLQIWVIAGYLLAMLAFFMGITLPSRSAAHRFGRAYVILSLLYLTLVVVPWGHGVTRFRLPSMVPILMFASLGLIHARAALARLSHFDRGDRGRAAVLLVLTGLLLAVCATRLPLLLAP